jgi:hypothetical protein
VIEPPSAPTIARLANSFATAFGAARSASSTQPNMQYRLTTESTVLLGLEVRCSHQQSSSHGALAMSETLERSWAVPGSNQRPPACKAGALPTELTALPSEHSLLCRLGRRRPLSVSGKCPQRDSNPRYHLERVATWAASRWGRPFEHSLRCWSAPAWRGRSNDGSCSRPDASAADWQRQPRTRLR